MLGADDLRVPVKQGREFYRGLKARNIITRWETNGFDLTNIILILDGGSIVDTVRCWWFKMPN